MPNELSGIFQSSVFRRFRVCVRAEVVEEDMINNDQ